MQGGYNPIHPSTAPMDAALDIFATTEGCRLTLCDLPKGSFDPHEDNRYTKLLKSLAPCDVVWEGDIHKASFAELLLSFIEFGNEGCARACAAAFEQAWGSLDAHDELAANIRFEAARSGKMSTLKLATSMVGGPPVNIRDMLIAARTGHARLVAEICEVLPSDVCIHSAVYIEDGELDYGTIFCDGSSCSCLACSTFMNMSDFECFVGCCLNWTFDEESVALIVKEVGDMLWKLPALYVRCIYKKCTHPGPSWMGVEALRYIMAYWPQPIVFLRGLIPDVDEFPDEFLHLMSRGLLVGKLREAQRTLEAGMAAELQRRVIRINTGLDLPASMADAMPIIVDYL